MKGWARPAAALAVFASAVSAAGAWGLTWRGAALQAVVESSRWKAGPLRIAPAFSLTSAGFDSNLYYGAGRLPVGDYTATLSLPTRVFIPIGRSLVLEADETPQYAHYVRVRNERSWNSLLNLDAHLVLKRLYLSAGGTSSDVRQRLSDEVEINVRRRTAEAHGLALWQAFRTVSIEGRVRTSRFDHENLLFDLEDIRGRLNRVETAAGLSLYHQRSATARFSLNGDLGDVTFTGSRAFKSSRSLAVTAGADLIQTLRVSGSILLGAKSVDVRDAARADFRGLVGAAALALRPGRRWELRGTFRRDVQVSVWSDYGYFVQSTVGAGLSRLLTRRVRLDYAVSRGWNRYPEQPGADAATPRRLDDFTVHSLSLRIQLDRYVRLELTGATAGRRTTIRPSAPERREVFGVNLIFG